MSNPVSKTRRVIVSGHGKIRISEKTEGREEGTQKASKKRTKTRR
jgi:hypothetical protein